MSNFNKSEKIIASYGMEKFSPFDYESFEFGGIYYTTRVRPGEFAEESFERASLFVEACANLQFDVKRLTFTQRRALSRDFDKLPEITRTPIIFTSQIEEDADDDQDDDQDRVFAPRRTADAGEKLTVCYGLEHFAPVKFQSFECGGQFYTTFVRDRETAFDAYERAWRVLVQVTERQYIQKCKAFHQRQGQLAAPLLEQVRNGFPESVRASIK